MFFENTKRTENEEIEKHSKNETTINKQNVNVVSVNSYVQPSFGTQPY